MPILIWYRKCPFYNHNQIGHATPGWRLLLQLAHLCWNFAPATPLAAHLHSLVVTQLTQVICF